MSRSVLFLISSFSLIAFIGWGVPLPSYPSWLQRLALAPATVAKAAPRAPRHPAAAAVRRHRRPATSPWEAPYASGQDSLVSGRAEGSFACTSAAYRIRQVGNTSLLERLDRVVTNGTVNYVATALYDTKLALNGLAYNYQDGYLYAFGVNSSRLYRLGNNGLVQDLGLVSGAPASGTNSATADLDGNMYLANSSSTVNTLYILNLKTLKMTSKALSQTTYFGDIAYNRLDNAIYGNRYFSTTLSNNGLYKVDLNGTSATLKVTVLGKPSINPKDEDMGTSFFDAAGSYYGASNQGRLIYFDITTGAAAPLGTAGITIQSDGASCVFPTNSIDVVLAAALPVRVSPTAFEVTYTVRVKNPGVLSNPNVQIAQFLNDGSNQAGASFPGAVVTVTSAPTVTAGAALAVNPNFNGSTTPGLLAGSTPLAPNEVSTLTYTLRVTYPSVAAIPTTPQSTLVFASTTSKGPNPGATLNNGVAVPPDGLLANDRSANSTTLPTTANGDEIVPTSTLFDNPLALDLTNVPVLNNAPATVLNPNLSAAPGLNGTGPAITSFIMNPPSSGTLRYDGAVVDGSVSVPNKPANLALLTFQPAAGSTASVLFSFVAIDAVGNRSNPATYTIPLARNIGGIVYEDVNYGGGAGRDRATLGSAAPGCPNVRVELYDGNGSFVMATTTAATGSYSFTVDPSATYTVRVVNNTVSSSRPGSRSDLLAVQTYNGTTDRVGGEAPEKADAAAATSGSTLASLTTATTIAQSQAQLLAGAAQVSSLDFGFNFDLVVNTADAGQGSLRQFVLNSNALGGEASLAQQGFYTDATTGAAKPLPASRETSIFLIADGQAHPGQRAGLVNQLSAQGVAELRPASALTVSGAATNVDGRTQTYNIGNTNDGLLGTGGTVGVDALVLSQLNGPEVQLTGSSAVAVGLDVGERS